MIYLIITINTPVSVAVFSLITHAKHTANQPRKSNRHNNFFSLHFKKCFFLCSCAVNRITNYKPNQIYCTTDCISCAVLCSCAVNCAVTLCSSCGILCSIFVLLCSFLLLLCSFLPFLCSTFLWSKLLLLRLLYFFYSYFTA